MNSSNWRKRLDAGLGLVVLCIAVLVVCSAVAHGAPSSGPEAGSKGSVAQPTPKADTAEDDFLASLDLRREETPEPEEAPAYITALNFILRLALVLALAYGTIYVLKRFTNLRGAAGPGRRNIRILENSMLAANRSLHLVEVGARKYLLASTPGQVNLIAEFGADELPGGDAVDTGSGFKDQLAMFLGRGSDSTSTARTVGQMLRDSSTFLQAKVTDLARIRGKFRNA